MPKGSVEHGDTLIYEREWWEQVHRAGRDQDLMYTRQAGANRMEWVKRLLLPLLHGRGRYLEFGCGLGRYTSWVADRVLPAGVVTGVDISRESIGRAEQRPNIHYTAASWDDLPYMGAFDVVLATEVLEHARDPEALVKRFPAAIWVITVPANRPAPAEGRWDAETGHGYQQEFTLDRTLSLLKEVHQFFYDGNYYYVVGKP